MNFIEYIVQLLNEYNNIAIIISILISIIVAILGIVPSLFVTGANIIVFGPVNGFFISLIGETLGGYITFKIYRKTFKKFGKNIDNMLINSIITSKGNKLVFLIFQGRLIPFIPSGVVTLAASISQVGDLGFTMATLIGKIPSILLEVVVSYGFVSTEEVWIKVFITILAIVLIYFTIRREEV